MLRSGAPTEPSSAEFVERLAAASRSFASAGVAAVYLVHGTFAGNDALGLCTELERYAPGLAQAFRRLTKRAFDAVLGETGNYTPGFAQRMESALGAGAPQAIPVRLFHWSSLNHHIGRADAAVRLIDELAALNPPPSKGGVRGGIKEPRGNAHRVLLWAHSHGGNALALLTNLLGADPSSRRDFFQTAGIFHRTWFGKGCCLPAWQRAEEILSDPNHPIRRLQLDIVTFGTPIRYGWNSAGYGKLLHIVNHRTHRADADYAARYPPSVRRLLAGVEGDFIQQLGIAGTNFAPLPLALRTFLADRRLGRLLQSDLEGPGLRARLKHGMRVPDEGATLLVDYDDPARWPHAHLFGHACYTRTRWLPFHCEQVAEHFYSS